MFLQVFRLNPNGMACNCVLVRDYPTGTSLTVPMGDAVNEGLAVYAGIYVVTQCDTLKTSATRMPFTHMLGVFTLHDDKTIEEGAKGAVRVPLLASWPAKVKDE